MDESETFSPSEFERSVMQYYGFLRNDYGFSPKKLGDWQIYLETHNTRVSLLVEHETLLSVALEPIGDAAKQLLRQNILPKGISVIVVSMCRDPNLQYTIARLHENSLTHNIPVELRRQADLLKKYCGSILKGDFAVWAIIDECMSKRAHEFLYI